MSINIAVRKTENELVFEYTPQNGIEYLKKWKADLNEDELEDASDGLNIWAHKIYPGYNEIQFPSDDKALFPVASIEGEYYKIKQDVFNLKHSFYFSKDLPFSIGLFLCQQNGYRESVLGVIDEMVQSDIYIETDEEKCSEQNHIPFESYKQLLDLFPKRAETQKYYRSRICGILSEYLSDSDSRVKEYEIFMEKKNRKLSEIKKASGFFDEDMFRQMQKHKFDLVRASREWLLYALDNAEALTEGVFQERILNVILSLFPKYIAAVREVKVDGIDEHDKIPDFLLIDSSGTVDVLEIKKPDKDLLRKTMYRNNYCPSCELSGAAVQIEKYIVCLQRTANKWEKASPTKIKTILPEGMKLQIINPYGMILMGRSTNMDTQQKKDFEIIRRHYMHIVDIISYDDLLSRIDSILESETIGDVI